MNFPVVYTHALSDIVLEYIKKVHDVYPGEPLRVDVELTEALELKVVITRNADTVRWPL